MAQFFINRPIFAWVIAIVIMLAGALSIKTLPLEQYPDIAPPRVTIGTQYTGASAETVENSVTQILEQQIKGIDNMLYMNSTSNASGQSRITLTFAPGTNIDVAQVQVQNKIQGAVNRLPDSVKSRGVFINKGGQDFLVTYSFYAADPDMDEVDIGDYINSNLVDVIGRIEGVGDINVFGTFYAMRIWMDPAKMEKYRLMPSDLVAALNNQNAQVSAGQLGALPAVKNQQLNATITARTKLKTPEEFEAVVLKTATDGAVVTIKDVARVELAADNLSIQAKLNGMRGAGMGVGVMALVEGLISLFALFGRSGVPRGWLLVYALAWNGGLRPGRVILAGVAVAALFGAGITSLLIFYSDRVHGALAWMAGGLAARTWPHVYMVWPYALVGGLIAMAMAGRLNLLQLGDDVARSLGLAVEKTRLLLIALAALLAASAVSVAGLLGFVGLIVPHAARLLIGSDHRFLLPAAGLLGAATVTFCDTIARTAFAPLELPVGVLMAALGAPFFLYLLRKEL